MESEGTAAGSPLLRKNKRSFISQTEGASPATFKNRRLSPSKITTVQMEDEGTDLQPSRFNSKRNTDSDVSLTL